MAATIAPCWTCKKRRLRCDGGRPACQRCTRASTECLGYGSTTPRRWRYYVMPPPRKPSNTNAMTCTLPQRLTVQMQREDDLAPAAVVLDALAYFNARVAPDLTPDATFKEDFSGWLDLCQPIRHLYMCTVALHRIVVAQPYECRTNPGKAAMSAVYQHQAHAARGVSATIAAATSRAPDPLLLNTVVMFISTQAQLGAYTSWRAHLDGAHGLLRLWGERALLGSNDWCYFFLMTTNVFGSAMTPAALLTDETLAQHAFYLSIIEVLDVDPMDSMIPVPWGLIKTTALVNMVRAKNKRPTHDGDDEGWQTREFLEFTASNIIMALQKDYSPLPSDDTPTEQGSGELWITAAFRAAIVIYLVSSTTQADSSTSWSASLHAQRRGAYDIAKATIARLVEQKTRGGTHYKFALWPMVVAGIEAVRVRDFGHVEMLWSQLGCMSKDIGSLGMRDAACFLRDLCAVRSAHVGSTDFPDWDDIFAASPLFII
ncbi:hypothetical protein PspLS_10150 [Pyricularia sp. CBS 133598]|nr:hypothetical protein PspLS_10150 [Pyricularia sp. CBS 133598]